MYKEKASKDGIWKFSSPASKANSDFPSFLHSWSYFIKSGKKDKKVVSILQTVTRARLPFVF